VGQQEAEHASHCETGAKTFAGKSFGGSGRALLVKGEIVGTRTFSLMVRSKESSNSMSKTDDRPTAKVKADIIAGEVIIRGNLKGASAQEAVSKLGTTAR